MLTRGQAVATAVVLSVTALGAQGGGIRDVTVSDRTLTALNTQLRFTTMVVLPEGEEIVDVICGDKENWVISATHNIAHVKPAKEKARTNLNLVASSGVIYSFLLTEAPGAPDLKVYVTNTDAKTDAAPKYYTAEAVDDLRGEVSRAHDAAAAAQASAVKQVEEARVALPAQLRFDYEFTADVKPFLIRSIWNNGTFTYVQTDAQELPAIYEMKDGQPSLVNFQVPTPGTYVVPKVLENGYFMLGAKQLAFKRHARGIR